MDPVSLTAALKEDLCVASTNAKNTFIQLERNISDFIRMRFKIEDIDQQRNEYSKYNFSDQHKMGEFIRYNYSDNPALTHGKLTIPQMLEYYNSSFQMIANTYSDLIHKYRQKNYDQSPMESENRYIYGFYVNGHKHALDHVIETGKMLNEHYNITADENKNLFVSNNDGAIEWMVTNIFLSLLKYTIAHYENILGGECPKSS